MNLTQQGKQALAAYAQTHHQLSPYGNTSHSDELTICELQAAPEDTVIDPQQPDINFMLFEDSELWQQQRDYFVTQGPKAWQQRNQPECVSHTIPLVNAYAQVILHYFVDGLQNGSIDSDQTVYLLELGAGSGRFAIQLLRTLEPLLKQHGLEGLDYCYLITDLAKENCQFIARHPYLQPYLEEGRAAVHCVDAENLDLQCDPTCPSTTGFLKPLPETENPLILVASYLFNSLSQSLLYVHYGELYSAEVALMPEQVGQNDTDECLEEGTSVAGSSQEKLAYRWHKQQSPEQWVRSQPELLQEFLRGQVGAYLQHLHSQPLLIPIAALSCLVKLQQHYDQGMLLLLADYGTSYKAQLSRQTLPNVKRSGSFSLPVNFDCIVNWLRQQGNMCRYIQHREQGTILNISIADKLQRSYPLTVQSTEKDLSEYNPDDFFQIKRSLHDAEHDLTDVQQLAYLRLSDYDPKLLAVFLPQLLREGILLHKRTTWCVALSRVWQNYVPVGENDDFTFRLGLLAINLSHWSLARQCFSAVIEFYGESAAIFHNLALIFHATGESKMAAHFVEYASKLAPGDQQVLELSAEIDSWRHYCEKLNWFFPEKARKAPLHLQPLGEHHSGEFWTQYQEANIATMLRSFKISTPTQTLAAIQYWIQQTDRADYAVLHSELGLVGVTSMTFCEAQTDAHFYFWIGKDYQGKGFGQQAAQLCIQQAAALDIQLIVTCAWQHNHCLQAALQKVGFKPLALTRGEGVNKEVYFFLSLSPRYDEKQLQKSAEEIIRQRWQLSEKQSNQVT